VASSTASLARASSRDLSAALTRTSSRFSSFFEVLVKSSAAVTSRAYQV